jgi:hypothetical protein
VQAFEAAITAEAWEEALSHYHGELLDGLHVAGAAPFTDWVDRERERLREAAADAAWRHAHALIAEGRLVEAERAGQTALRLVPTDESAVREFIRALAEGGDRAGALRFYDKFATVLAQELEVEPARETQAVTARIRSGEVVVNLRTPPPGVITPLPFPPVARAKEPEGAGVEEAAEAGADTRLTTAPRRWRRRLTIGGALAGVATVAALAYVAPRPDPLYLTVTDVQPVTSEPGVEWLAAISPDGGMVAYVAGSHVEIRSTVSGGEGGGVRLAGRGLISSSRPAWRGDGEFLRFFGCRSRGSARGWRSGAWAGPSAPFRFPLAFPPPTRTWPGRPTTLRWHSSGAIPCSSRSRRAVCAPSSSWSPPSAISGTATPSPGPPPRGASRL